MKRVVLLQTVVPAYRVSLFKSLRYQAGSGSHELEIFAGSSYFDGSTSTAPDAPIVVRLDNQFLFGRRLLWQRGALRSAISADAVIAEFNPRILSTWFLTLGRRCLGRPTLLWGHTLPRDQRASGLSPLLRRLLLRLSWGFIAYSQAEADTLRSLAPGVSSFVAPNALFSRSELEAVSPVAALGRPMPGSGSVVFSGRLTPDKRPTDAVDAFAIADLPQTVNLVFIGDGPLRKAVRQRAVEHGIGHRVHLIGSRYSLPEIARVYQNAFASLSPGYVGLSAVQSLYFGVPVVYRREAMHAPELLVADELGGAFGGSRVEGLSQHLSDLYARSAADRKSLASATRREHVVESWVEGMLAAINSVA